MQTDRDMDRTTLQSRGTKRCSEELDDAIYRDFVESVTVSREVLAVLVSMPEIASVEQAKAYVRAAGKTSQPDQYSRIATSKYQDRRISSTSNSLAKAGENAW